MHRQCVPSPLSLQEKESGVEASSGVALWSRAFLESHITSGKWSLAMCDLRTLLHSSMGVPEVSKVAGSKSEVGGRFWITL